MGPSWRKWPSETPTPGIFSAEFQIFSISYTVLGQVLKQRRSIMSDGKTISFTEINIIEVMGDTSIILLRGPELM